MEPIVLIHGYSAEGAEDGNISDIYGKLPDELREWVGSNPIVPVNVGRYVSLDDRVDLEDVTLALDRVLKREHPHLLQNGFNAIVHSTGALVMRNWIRRCCKPKPDGEPLSDTNRAPVRRLIYLAGANLGSGWAHVGESELARWLRFIGQGGAQRGLAVLDALELGSPWTIDLHRHFLEAGNSMLEDYGVLEFCIIGSQVPAEWRIIPVRYGAEDGADGVVRTAACNLNFNYLRIGAALEPVGIAWEDASDFARKIAEGQMSGTDFDGKQFAGPYYQVLEDRRPEGVLHPERAFRLVQRPRVPFAIPFQCAHSTSEIGVVAGTKTRPDRERLLKAALTATPDSYKDLVGFFDQVTQETYDRIRAENNAFHLGAMLLPKLDLFERPQEQYDGHAQLVIRVRDQNLKPVREASIFFNSFGGGGTPDRLINDLFEDKHINNGSRHCTTYYLRLHTWDNTQKDWTNRLAEVKGADLEIDVQDTLTRRILFVPLRMRIPASELAQWLQPHRTTIIDVELLRLPSVDTFRIAPDV